VCREKERRAGVVIPDVDADSPSDAAASLVENLGARGWKFAQEPGRVVARKHEWPAQVHVLIDFGTAGDASLALVVDMGTMPLGGERFREIFNGNREQSLRGFGNFRVRQFLADGRWALDVSDNAFLYGATTGISRAARLVYFDRRPAERGRALVARFIAESNRFVETGNQIGAVLQRVYQRTVLGSPTTPVALPRLVAAGSAASNPFVDEAYPWRG
jgi:hypothetical protein